MRESLALFLDLRRASGAILLPRILYKQIVALPTPFRVLIPLVIGSKG
jgi:hypothetical protein